MHDIPVLGVLNGALFAIAGLGLFVLCVSVARKALPATDLQQAIVVAAVILGAAIIIALTMH